MSVKELSDGEKKLTYRCVHCCRHPIWDLWSIDISRNDEMKIINEWQLKCDGALHDFSISYSQDKIFCIKEWNSKMEKIFDNENV